MPPMTADWPDPGGGVVPHGGLTSALPRPWGSVLGGTTVTMYLMLAALGVYSALNRWPEAGGDEVVLLGALAGSSVALFGTANAVCKAMGWWQAEWVMLWFLAAGLVIHAVVESFGPGWPEWVLAEAFFILWCGHRAISLLVFAKQARWGADRRHLIQRRYRPNYGEARA